MKKRVAGMLTTLLGLGAILASSAWAEEAVSEATKGNTYSIDTMWLLITSAFVFLMQPGFGMLEAGLTRAKNAVNIMSKNFMDFCIGSVCYFLVGYAFMYGDGNGFIGLTGFALDGLKASNVPVWASWWFQAVFAGAAATIVSGAMAERTKFTSYMIMVVAMCSFIYPVIGKWQWGGGWLSQMGFFDFAGSSIVHSTGGWAGLAGAILLGPRIGKYGPDGKPKVLAGHNIPFAAAGVFILWFGWFGFNPGSQLAAAGISNAEAISLITLNTNMAAAAGALTGMFTAWMLFGKPDLTMCMNGALAGLVGITAPCAVVSPLASIVIGAIAGVLVVLSVMFFDRIGVDDPVGAVSVHGVCGVYGTFAVGIWGQKALGLANDGLLWGGGFTQLGIQILGGVSIALFSLICTCVVLYLCKVTIGIRVSREEEIRGLDIEEHGLEAYADFPVFTSR
ncbi:MAG: ammonium transporter [Deltaproteobacteria bacterium]|nr:ammonium transporter [Deltaproteobacteria bacterium]